MKGFVTLLCGLCGVLCVFEIFNFTSVKRTVAFVFSVALLAALTKTSPPRFSSASVSLTAEDCSVYYRTAEVLIGDLLKSNQIDFKDIAVYTDKTQSDSIIITKVTVTTDFADKNYVENVIKDNTAAVNVEVKNE